MKVTSVRSVVLGLLLILVGGVGGFGLVQLVRKAGSIFPAKPEITWVQLAKVDLGLESVPPEIENLLSSDIRIAGFVVPLSDNFQEIQEFLLVPDPMSCIHVPPPPANQMVLVRLQDPMDPQLAYGPVWASGRLEIKGLNTEFGTVGFQIEAEKVMRYDGKPF